MACEVAITKASGKLGPNHYRDGAGDRLEGQDAKGPHQYNCCLLSWLHKQWLLLIPPNNPKSLRITDSDPVSHSFWYFSQFFTKFPRQDSARDHQYVPGRSRENGRQTLQGRPSELWRHFRWVQTTANCAICSYNKNIGIRQARIVCSLMTRSYVRLRLLITAGSQPESRIYGLCRKVSSTVPIKSGLRYSTQLAFISWTAEPLLSEVRVQESLRSQRAFR